MVEPVSIQHAKLQEWLISRRAIPENYGRLLQGLDAQISAALAEAVDSAEVKALIAQHKENMQHFAVLDIYDAIAKSPEGQQKNFLGAHTNPTAAKWKSAADAGKRRNLGWASAARVLINNLSYEVPALKRQQAACQQQITDCDQKIAELTAAEAKAKSRHADLLKELGVDGFDLKRELRKRAASELEKVLQECAGLVQEVGKDLHDFYKAYACHAHKVPSATADDFLPLLLVLHRMGNAAFEDVAAEVSVLKDVPVPTAMQLEESLEAGGGIQWDIQAPSATAEEQQAGGISWDFSVDDGGEAVSGGGINWDFQVDEGGAAAAGGDEAVIEFAPASFAGMEISAEEDDGAALVSGVGFAVEEAGTSEQPRPRVLDSAQACELLFQEVAEVGAFLQSRRNEMSSNQGGDDEPEEARRAPDEVKRLIAAAERLEELLTGKATLRLRLLRDSSRYVEQTAQRVDIAKAQIGKVAARRAQVEKQRPEQEEEVRKLKAEMEKLMQTMVGLKKRLEEALSAHFKAQITISVPAA